MISYNTARTEFNYPIEMPTFVPHSIQFHIDSIQNSLRFQLNFKQGIQLAIRLIMVGIVRSGESSIFYYLFVFLIGIVMNL